MSRTKESSDHLHSDTLRDAFDGAGDRLSQAAESAKKTAIECGNHHVAEPAKDLFGILKDYAGSRPDVAAAWCFGMGIYIGWKLRP